jgi:hypothetical protein
VHGKQRRVDKNQTNVAGHFLDQRPHSVGSAVSFSELRAADSFRAFLVLHHLINPLPYPFEINGLTPINSNLLLRVWNAGGFS